MNKIAARIVAAVVLTAGTFQAIAAAPVAPSTPTSPTITKGGPTTPPATCPRENACH